MLKYLSDTELGIKIPIHLGNQGKREERLFKMLKVFPWGNF